ncbi:hypothetical protein [Pseudomonas monteilii]|uniref:hypothetical protein n=1 Tax=Pseudomonas monteilii TaxID=76759 RepID=UPI000F7391EB|nr:hypothetical protein [Pseudomonas monteilii]
MNKDSIDSLTTLLAQPAPQPHPEPIAWMVGTAFWWTKEEAERDAAATGLPMFPFGPLTGAAPAEQHQGEPVAWMFKVRVHATGLGLVWREKIEQYAPDTEMVEVRDLVPLYSRPAHGDPVAWVSPVQLSPVNAQYDLGFADGCAESKRLNDQADAVEAARAALERTPQVKS